MKKAVDKWFLLSILSIFCGCGLLGLVPVYMTHTAKAAVQAGDMATVEKNLKIAKICVILGWVWLVLYGLGLVVWLLVGGGLAMMGM
jgi:predicted small lipoprotein YifL